MELSTFGAVMRFAIDRESQAVAFYERAARGSVQEVFVELAQGARRRVQRLEQARREGVVEMILQPITGLESERYEVDLGPEAGEVDLQQVVAFEEAGERFYKEAAERMPIREVARVFEQLAQESRTRIELLRKMRLKK